MNKGRKRAIILICAAAAVLAAAGITAAVWLAEDPLEKALNPAAYGRVQVTLTQKQELAEGAEPGGAQEGSYDENGEPAQPDQTPAQARTIAVMCKDGERVYEEGLGGRYYFYTRDGQEYVLVYDDMSGALREGEWVEAPAEQFSLRPLFSVDRLAAVDADGFEKVDGVYRPDYVHLAPAFFGLLGIGEGSMDKYADYSLELRVDQNRLQSITAHYVYDKTYQVEETYTFANADTTVALPQPTA